MRGLDYYTGPIFELSIKKGPSIGSVAGGGRYDKLICLYGGRDTPATGISLGIERLYEIMNSEKMFRVPVTRTRVFVVPVRADDKLQREALRIAGKAQGRGDTRGH